MTVIFDLILLGIVNLLFPSADDATVESDTEYFTFEEIIDDERT